MIRLENSNSLFFEMLTHHEICHIITIIAIHTVLISHLFIGQVIVDIRFLFIESGKDICGIIIIL